MASADMPSVVQKTGTSAEMGKQHATQRVDNCFDDFEDGLVFTEGPLRLRLHKAAAGQHNRPLTSHSDLSSSASMSGSSIIFSNASSTESASESEDQHEFSVELNAKLSKRAQVTAVRARGHHSLDHIARPDAGSHIEAAYHSQDNFDGDDDDNDRSNTIKANQLPSDFAELLAQSKLEAARAKESGTLDSRTPLQNTREEALPHSSSSASTAKCSASSPPDEDDFFDDLEIPMHFSGQGGRTNITSLPLATGSRQSEANNAQAPVKHRTGAGPASHGGSSPPPLRDADVRALATHSDTGKRTTTTSKRREHSEELLDDSFDFEGLSFNIVKRMDNKASSSVARSIIPSTAQTEKIASVPSNSKTPSELSNTRSKAILRPSPSLSNLNPASSEGAKSAEPTHPSKSKSSWGHKGGKMNNTSTLRSRPSLSNLSSGSSPSVVSKPQTLRRKASINALADQVTGPASLIERSTSSLAHYAQPTRSSLARHHLPSTTAGSPGTSSRPAMPLDSSSLSQETKPHMTTSPSSNTFSRLTRHTIASSAKTHKPSGSDPSGRTSASLGMPIAPGPSSPLKSMRMIRSNGTMIYYGQSKRDAMHGDGSELDGFDDLPVDREQERKFVKVPMRRRQSSGVTSVDSNPSSSGSLRKPPVSQTSLQVVQRGARARIGSTTEPSRAMRAHSTIDRNSTTSKSVKQDRLLTKPDLPPSRGNASAAVNSLTRTGPKLIRNLSAFGLSRVQGQMKWNPVLLKWEGNESSLRDFDNAIASSARPALISPLGPLSPAQVYPSSPLTAASAEPGQGPKPSSIEERLKSISNPYGTTPSLGGVRVVGNMIFDPIKRSWFSMSAEGEDELNFGDDEGDDTSSSNAENAAAVDAWADGEQMRLKTRRSFANDWSSDASSHGDDHESSWNIEAFKRKQRDAASRHEHEILSWKHALRGSRS